jgi:polyhydroxybutyrate depolymerase
VSATRIGAIVVGVSIVAIAVALVALLIRSRPALHGGEDLEPAAHAYSANERVACPAGSRSGTSEPAEAATPRGVGYVVKPPANYDPLRAHPLIVVYAPRGVSRRVSERLVGLTRAATAGGFVVAYADSRPLDMATIGDLATLPEAIASRWCIDERRVYLTGHSDGGTVATAIAVLGKGRVRPSAIAPSAAGFRREDLARYDCPPPLGVMVLHSRADELFPGFGRGAAEWWASCNGCGSEPEKRPDGCLAYPACRPGGETIYCEGEGRHADWPGRNADMLDFFRRASTLTESTVFAPEAAEGMRAGTLARGD